jgi:hypothetical protein
MNACNKLVFVPVLPFQPSLVFVDNAGVNPSEDLSGDPLQVRLLWSVLKTYDDNRK